MYKRYPDEGTSPANDPAPTILIVDNSELLRTALFGWLSAVFPDCRFQEATSGEEALALTVIQPATIVLMNIKLPQMTGLEAARHMKGISPRLQVVLMSFYED